MSVHLFDHMSGQHVVLFRAASCIASQLGSLPLRHHARKLDKTPVIKAGHSACDQTPVDRPPVIKDPLLRKHLWSNPLWSNPLWSKPLWSKLDCGQTPYGQSTCGQRCRNPYIYLYSNPYTYTLPYHYP